MDFIQDILRHCNPQSSGITRTRFFEPLVWTVPAVERVAGFQLVTQGEALLRSPEIRSPITLHTGDLVVFVRLFDYEIASPGPSPGSHRSLSTPPEAPRNSAAPLATLVTGGFVFKDAALEGGFVELPRYFIIRSDGVDDDLQLKGVLRLMCGELDVANPAANPYVRRLLLELFFNYALAHWQERQATDSRAVKDTYIFRALKLMHEDVAREWTLGDLMRASGLSRKIFFDRFKRATGSTPSQYLARLRMDRAKELLRTTNKPLRQIALEVGYADAFAFSKAFKRIEDRTPRTYRAAATPP